MPQKTNKTVGTGFITEVDRYLFGQGTHYEIYEKLGAHPKTYKNQDGMYFAVWAPHAVQVSLVGDFNGWNPDANPMSVLEDSGIWEIFIPGMGVGQLYKYAITVTSGKILFKADRSPPHRRGAACAPPYPIPDTSRGLPCRAAAGRRPFAPYGYASCCGSPAQRSRLRC